MCWHTSLTTAYLACREIPVAEYEAWAVRHEEAKSALVNRSAQIDESAERIECDLVLLGATAIEDKLQEVSGVCSRFIKDLHILFISYRSLNL